LKIEKIRTVLGLLIILGFLSTFAGGVRNVYGNPDGVTDNFDNENYIASRPNLVVTGGQVKLDQVTVWESSCMAPGCNLVCQDFCTSNGHTGCIEKVCWLPSGSNCSGTAYGSPYHRSCTDRIFPGCASFGGTCKCYCFD